MNNSHTYLEIDLGENGGKLSFRSASRVVDWVNREEKQWEWLTALPGGGAHANLPTLIRQIFDQMQTASQRAERSELTADQLRGLLDANYRSDPPRVFHSAGRVGSAVLAIRAEQGDYNAGLAYGFVNKAVNLDIVSPEHFRLLSLVSQPQQISRDARAAAAGESYRAILNAAENLIEKQNAFSESAENEWRSKVQEAERAGTTSLLRALKLYAKARRRDRQRANQAVSSIQATEAAFAEKMRLKASVDYWQEKKANHQLEETTTRKILLWFIAIGGSFALVVFGIVVVFMLEMAGADATRFIDGRAADAPPLPATPFLIVAAGLGAFLTAVFWAARILVRNYLTERALKLDAEERKVMTMTYLALIEEGAVAEEDRLVILNALFRPTPDPLGHDDGPQEIALPAIMAKLIDQRGVR